MDLLERFLGSVIVTLCCNFGLYLGAKQRYN